MTLWPVARQALLSMRFSKQESWSWLQFFSSRGSSSPRDGNHSSCASCIGRQILYHRTTWKAPTSHKAQPGSPLLKKIKSLGRNACVIGIFLFLFKKNIFTTCCGLQDLSSPNRDWTWATAVKALNPTCWTTREFLAYSSL